MKGLLPFAFSFSPSGEKMMKALVLFALLAMAVLARAEGASQEDAMQSEDGALSLQAGSLPTAQERLIVAQVAAETATLAPREKPDFARSPKNVRKPARTARRQSRSVIYPPRRDYKPAPIKSRFQSNAEQFAKANGCAAPVAKMNFAVTGGADTFETFTATCGGNAPMSIRCDPSQCRAM